MPSNDLLIPLLIVVGALVLVLIVYFLSRPNPSKADIVAPTLQPKKRRRSAADENPPRPVNDREVTAGELTAWHRQHEEAILDWISDHEDQLADDPSVGADPDDQIEAAFTEAVDAHPSRVMGAELSAMRAAGASSLRSLRRGDDNGAQTHHETYLRYRTSWLERLWQFARNRSRVAALRTGAVVLDLREPDPEAMEASADLLFDDDGAPAEPDHDTDDTVDDAYTVDGADGDDEVGTDNDVDDEVDSEAGTQHAPSDRVAIDTNDADDEADAEPATADDSDARSDEDDGEGEAEDEDDEEEDQATDDGAVIVDLTALDAAGDGEASPGDTDVDLTLEDEVSAGPGTDIETGEDDGSDGTTNVDTDNEDHTTNVEDDEHTDNDTPDEDHDEEHSPAGTLAEHASKDHDEEHSPAGTLAEHTDNDTPDEDDGEEHSPAGTLAEHASKDHDEEHDEDDTSEPAEVGTDAAVATSGTAGITHRIVSTEAQPRKPGLIGRLGRRKNP